MHKVEFFHIGPQKSGTTWLYQCFSQHPELCVAPKDTIHYFDVFYHKGEEWYQSHFKKKDLHLIDTTTSYIRSPYVAERIAAYNPEAKIMLCLRNPIERAFSHYWHNKKKSEYDVPFSRFVTNYDLFASWIETGFYANHIERYLNYFPREQILVQNFAELESDAAAFLKSTYEFMEVDKSHRPDVLNKKVNAAKAQKSKSEIRLDQTLGQMRFKWASKPIKSTLRKIGILPSLKQETLEDVDKETIAILNDIFEPEIQKLEKLLDVKFPDWRKSVD